MMKCRGNEKRKEIIRNYLLHPIAHVKLLAGQEKISCAGSLVKITDTYYCFILST